MKIRKLLSISKAYLDLLLFAVPALILTLIFALSARNTAASAEPSAVHADSHDNSSVYYSSNTQASQENASSADVNSRNIKNYMIRIYGEKIAIFEEGSAEPIYVLETSPARLPEEDRQLLEQGIQAESLAAAYKLIEDYE